MERLSDTAIEIINDLHTERLEYASEYIPLIDAANRLAAYEDTGLDPEEIADFMKRWEQAVEIGGMLKKYGIDHIWDIIQAEQDGRLVVLPWAVGDIIYEADPAHGVVKHTFAENPAWMMHSYAEDDAGNVWYDGWGSSDETPFYKTREEAEAALKGGEG